MTRVPALAPLLLVACGLATHPAAACACDPPGSSARTGVPSPFPPPTEVSGLRPETIPPWLAARLAAAAMPPVSRAPGQAALPPDPDPVCAIAAPGDTTVVKANGITGMSAVVELLMELEPLYPGAGALWRGGLDWMVSHAHPGNPGCKWIWLENDSTYGDDYPHQIAGWNAMALAEGWARTGSPCYLERARGAMEWLAAERLPLDTIPGGAGMTGCAYVEWGIPYPHFYNIGSLGFAGIGRAALEVYRLTGDTNALDVARCLAETFRSTATDDSVWGGKKWGVFAPWVQGLYITSFCNGTSGIVEFLMEMSVSFPAETGYEALARDGLAWLEALAVPDTAAALQPAYMWPAREDVPDSELVYLKIVGQGAAGIGRVFLRAYETYGDSEYLRLARGAGNWLLSVADTSGGTMNWGDGSNPWWANWCVGQIGIMNFLGDLHDATGEAAYGAAFDEAVAWLSGLSVPAYGGAVFPNLEGGDSTSTDFIWGFTGLANTYYDDAAGRLWEPQNSALYSQALQFLDGFKIAEDGGYTWAWHVSLLPTGVADPPIDPAVRGGGAAIRGIARPNPARGAVTIETPFPAAGGSAGSGGGSAGLDPGAAVGHAPARPSLRIVDVSGRVVRVLPGDAARVAPRPGPSADPASFAATSPALLWEWDGRDALGRRVPQGTYLASLDRREGSPSPPAVRVTILR